MPHKKWSFKDFLRQMKGKELMWNDNQIGYWVPQTNKNVCCRATLHILARNLICNFTHIRCLLWNTANQASTEKLTRGITQTSFGYGWVHDYEKFISTRGLPYVTSAKFSDFVTVTNQMIQRRAQRAFEVWTHWILSYVSNRLAYDWTNLHQTFRGCRGKGQDQPREEIFLIRQCLRNSLLQSSECRSYVGEVVR